MTPSYTTTARNALRALLNTSKIEDVDAGFNALASDIDTKMLGYLSGTTAARPAAGIENRLYKATDTGYLYHDTGTEWERIIVGSQALSTLDAFTVGAFAMTAFQFYELSATRPTWVSISISSGGNTTLSVKYGSYPIELPRTTGGGGKVAIGFLLPAGASFACNGAGATAAYTIL
jgi:hypothetical protein